MVLGGDRPGSSWATDSYDVTGADALEVIDWAREQAGDGLFAVALGRDDLHRMSEAARRGRVWLVGHDANGRPTSETQQRFADRMHAKQTSSRYEYRDQCGGWTSRSVAVRSVITAMSPVTDPRDRVQDARPVPRHCQVPSPSRPPSGG